jgi:peptidoglycan/xylan/chitin deacetylase (PgdA/CDA1 family)
VPISRSLLSLAYPPLFALNRLRRRPRLRVLLCHDVPPDRIGDFAEMLEWLMRRWRFVSPARFAELLTGKARLDRDTLLLTFDDGFASNRVVADRVLAPRGISALFFIVTAFMELDGVEAQARFIRGNLGLNLPAVPAHMRGMSLDDLRHLVAAGHVLGAHTGTHMRLSSTAWREQLADEIVAAADRLERSVGTTLEHFAFPFGTLESFSPLALEIARRRFAFVHTGMRGNNTPGTPAWAVRRDAVSIDDSRMLTGAFLEGAADGRYTGKLATYESWGK